MVEIPTSLLTDPRVGGPAPDAGAGVASEAPAPVPAVLPTAGTVGASTEAIEHGGPAARMRGVHRAFGSQVVLDRLDLDVAPGEFVAVLGRSGCGKSTLLRILAGLDTEAEGEVRAAAPRALVFQEHRLLPWKRVAANVGLGLPRTRRPDLVAGVLAEVGLTARADAWPRTLSGGEAQRVALARALVRQPALLLLDEPFGALDALTRLRMHALLADLCRRHAPAVVLVTHDVDEAIALADRVLVLDGGRFAADHRVGIAGPRHRTDLRVAELRRILLAALGVDEGAVPAGPAGAGAPNPPGGGTGTGATPAVPSTNNPLTTDRLETAP